MRFSYKLPVEFRDYDGMGHVNHAVYLQYMETTRVELARKLGLVRGGFRSPMIMAMCHCEYKKPITDERSITVTIWVSRIGEKSWDLDYTIRGRNGVEYAMGRTTQVGYDYDSNSTDKVSLKLRKSLRKYAGRPLELRGFRQPVARE